MKRFFVIGMGLVAIATPWAMAQNSGAYESGHGALQMFDAEGRASAPLWVKIWLGILLATFAAGLLFVWRQTIARWAVGGFIAGIAISGSVFEALGLPYLSGAIAIGHLVFWTPALILLIWKRPFLHASESAAFRAWSAMMMAVIIFSFVFDIRDAAIYVAHILS